MSRGNLMVVCARNVVEMYDPYELADVGGDEVDLFFEVMRLLEEDPKAVLDWLTWV